MFECVCMYPVGGQRVLINIMVRNKKSAVPCYDICCRKFRSHKSWANAIYFRSRLWNECNIMGGEMYAWEGFVSIPGSHVYGRKNYMFSYTPRVMHLKQDSLIVLILSYRYIYIYMFTVNKDIPLKMVGTPLILFLFDNPLRQFDTPYKYDHSWDNPLTKMFMLETPYKTCICSHYNFLENFAPIYNTRPLTTICYF